MFNTLKSDKKVPILFCMAFVLALFSPNAIWAFEKTVTNSLGMEFVLIPAGTFTMGSPPDEPGRERNEVAHTAKISSPFYLQTTEVTVKQWRDIMGKPFFGRKKGTENMPVARVSWQDCIKFIKKLNAKNDGVYRLPTEAEWEYACKAGNTTAYGIGESIDCNSAMYANNTLKRADCVNAVKSKGLPSDQPAPVKSYAPNALGLYDMQGNVWEWCEDWYRPYQPDVAVKPQTQGETPSIETGTDKVRRGGSWYGNGSRCRCANRNYSHFANRYQTTGFRLVRIEKIREELSRSDEDSERLKAGVKQPRSQVGQRSAESNRSDFMPAKVRLRNASTAVGLSDFRIMLKQFNFFLLTDNETGVFHNDFEDLGPDVVIDKTTGLMWEKGGSSSPLCYADAVDYVEKLNEQGLADYKDWRIPTLEELCSLLQSQMKGDEVFPGAEGWRPPSQLVLRTPEESPEMRSLSNYPINPSPRGEGRKESGFPLVKPCWTCDINATPFYPESYRRHYVVDLFSAEAYGAFVESGASQENKLIKAVRTAAK